MAASDGRTEGRTDRQSEDNSDFSRIENTLKIWKIFVINIAIKLKADARRHQIEFHSISFVIKTKRTLFKN
jgi:hypothetical protein